MEDFFFQIITDYQLLDIGYLAVNYVRSFMVHLVICAGSPKEVTHYFA